MKQTVSLNVKGNISIEFYNGSWDTSLFSHYICYVSRRQIPYCCGCSQQLNTRVNLLN